MNTARLFDTPAFMRCCSVNCAYVHASTLLQRAIGNDGGHSRRRSSKGSLPWPGKGDVIGLLSSTLCPLPSALCPLPSTLYPLPSTLCWAPRHRPAPAATRSTILYYATTTYVILYYTVLYDSLPYSGAAPQAGAAGYAQMRAAVQTQLKQKFRRGAGTE